MSKKEHKWVTVFLEVALRAIRRIHFEYGLWGVGHHWKTGPGKPGLINLGPGIELADERTVCAAIAQEFMSSPSLTGVWEDEDGEEVRFFSVRREQIYKGAQENDESKWVDLVIEKYRQTSNGKFKLKRPRSFIEAKRARRWRVNHETGEVTPDSYLDDEVRSDITKLRDERTALRGKEKVLLHVLVWGVYENDAREHPEGFFHAVQEQTDARLDGPYVRWLPMKWECPEEATGHPTVQRSAWVAIAEVDTPERT